MQEAFISSISFKVSDDTTNNALVNVSFNIQFDDNVVLNNISGSNDISAFPNNSLASNQPISVKNPTFTQIKLGNAQTNAIYSAVETAVTNYASSHGNKLSLSDFQPVSTDLINSVKQNLLTNLSAQNLQLVDIPAVNLYANVNSSDTNKLNVNFSVSFGPNVSLANDFSGQLVKDSNSANTLRSNQPISIDNGQAPAGSSLNQASVNKIKATIQTSLLSLNQSRYDSNSLNSDNGYLDGLKATIAAQLKGVPGINNFSDKNITSIHFGSFETDPNTNMMSVKNIEIGFNYQVKVGNSGDGYTVSDNSITIDSIDLNQAQGAFITQASLDKINELINSGYHNYFTDQKKVNATSLKNSEFINSIVNSIISTLNVGPFNAQLNASNLNLSFDYSQGQGLSASSVSYSLVFKDDVKFAQNVVAGSDYNFDTGTSTLSNKKPISVDTVVLDQQSVSNIYNIVQDAVKGVQPGNLTEQTLNGLKDGINASINDQLSPSTQNIIESLKFTVDNQTNSATAAISFINDVIVSPFSVPNCVWNDASSLTMSFDNLGISSYVTDANMETLKNDVTAYVNSQGINNAANENDATTILNANIGVLLNNLNTHKFNTSLLNNPSFSGVSFQDNSVTFNVTFKDGTKFQTPSTPLSYTQTITPSTSLNNVLTQSALDSITTTVVNRMNSIYTEQSNQNNNFANLQTKLDEIKGNITGGLGSFNTNLFTNPTFTASLDSNNTVTMTYSFIISKDASIPSGLNTNGFSVTKVDSGTQYSITITKADAVTRTVVDQNVLANLYNIIKNTYTPIYQNTLIANNSTIIQSYTIDNQVSTINDQFVKNNGNSLSALNPTVSVSTANAGDLKMGKVNVKVTFGNNLKANYIGVANNPYFTVDTAAGTITTKQPIDCGTGLFNFDTNGSLTSLTAKGQHANQLVLTSYSPLGFGSGCFRGSQATNIVLPSNQKNISLPSGLFANLNSLQSVTNLWDNSHIKTIPANLFQNDSNYTQAVTVGDWVTSLDPSAFSGCTNLNTLDFTNGIHCNNGNNLDEQSLSSILTVANRVTNIIIPDGFDMYSCMRDGKLAEAFRGMQRAFDLTYVGAARFQEGFFGTYPSWGLYNGTIKVRSVNIGNLLYGCPDVLFCGNENIEEFHFSNYTVNPKAPYSYSDFVVGQSAFQDCVNLRRCSFLEPEGAGVDVFQMYCFQNCTSLTNVQFGLGLNSQTFNYHSFYGATLRSAPNQQIQIYAYSIAMNAFEGCNAYDGVTGKRLNYGILSSATTYQGQIAFDSAGPGPNQICPWGNLVLFAPGSSDYNRAAAGFQG